MRFYSISKKPRRNRRRFVYTDAAGKRQFMYSKYAPSQIDIADVNKVVMFSIAIIFFLFVLLIVSAFTNPLLPPVHLEADKTRTISEIRIEDPYNLVEDKTALTESLARFQAKTNITPGIVFADSSGQTQGQLLSSAATSLYGSNFVYGQYWIIVVDTNANTDLQKAVNTVRTESTMDSNRVDTVAAFKRDLATHLSAGMPIGNALEKSIDYTTEHFYDYNWTFDITLILLLAALGCSVFSILLYRRTVLMFMEAEEAPYERMPVQNATYSHIPYQSQYDSPYQERQLANEENRIPSQQQEYDPDDPLGLNSYDPSKRFEKEEIVDDMMPVRRQVRRIGDPRRHQ